MKVRMAKPEDIPVGIAMSRIFYEEGEFEGGVFEPQAAEKFAMEVMQSPNGFCCLAEDDEGAIRGMHLGGIVQHMFGTTGQAISYIFFVEPSSRGGTAGRQMVRKFEKWAKEKGVLDVLAGNDSGIEIERTKGFYEALGYHVVGYQFKKLLTDDIEKEKENG
tara:strand:+ start:368 stop:853 length:486 start_codon:yes stop_codon:yes gene_type:complete